MTEAPQADVQVLINNLDKRGLMVLQIMLGERAIQILEAEKAEKPPFLKPSALLLPGSVNGH